MMNTTAPRTILLADDDKDDVFFLKRAVERIDPTSKVFGVPDGQECVDYLSGEGDYSDRAKSPYPDLIVLDLKMPRKSGHEVLRWLRQQPQLKAVPVVVLSGSVIPEDRNESLREGAIGYFSKPSDFEELVAIIKQVCARLQQADGK